MAEIIGVKFKETGKVYYFDPAGNRVQKDQKVIVETVRGVECGVCATPNSSVPDEQIVKPLKSIVRVASPEDLETLERNKEKEARAYEICRQKIEQYKLDMSLVEVEYTFDGSKILFFYTAPERVDFRELVKSLASVFRVRIELRQIGVRDEARMLGGLGPCGRPFCCSEFLHDFQPVSIKMAKEQGLSLNTIKISGTCGRLMCCLKYEQDSYDYLLKHTPKVGAIVETAEGRGEVVDNNLLTGMLKVKLDRNPDAAPASVHRRDVKLIRDSQIRVNKAELEALGEIE
ncbi:MAG: stage 0 sporulation family protein [Clostridia bacterium]|nr:stage 0 sporulation family protein [Clostridia bacterium]MBR5424446.1 stage 0 sporulation family protein [Clostridia bacterium]